MTTVANVLNVARGHLLGGTDDELNRLSAAYTAGGTSLTMEFDLGTIARKARLGVELEEFHVWSTSGQIVTVSGAQNGSTAADHASGTLVRVNPQFSDYSLFTALNEELQALASRGLVKVDSVTLTASSATTGYNLTGTSQVLGIRSIRREQTGSSKNWPGVRQYRADLGTADSTDFASGNAVMIYEHVDPGRSIIVTYEAPLSKVSALSDVVETVAGLHVEAHDILSMGIALRRMAGREIKRNFTDRQGDPRRADEVPPGAVQQSTRSLQSLYESRIEQEIERLAQRYPTVVPT